MVMLRTELTLHDVSAFIVMENSPHLFQNTQNIEKIINKHDRNKHGKMTN